MTRNTANKTSGKKLLRDISSGVTNRTEQSLPSKYKHSYVPSLLFVENLKSPRLPVSQKSRVKQSMMRTIESQSQCLMEEWD